MGCTLHELGRVSFRRVVRKVSHLAKNPSPLAADDDSPQLSAARLKAIFFGDLGSFAAPRKKGHASIGLTGILACDNPNWRNSVYK